MPKMRKIHLQPGGDFIHVTQVNVKINFLDVILAVIIVKLLLFCF